VKYKRVSKLAIKTGTYDTNVDELSTLYQPSSVCLSLAGLRPSSSLSTGCVVSLRGDWAIFCHAGSGRVGVWSAREKSLEMLRRGWELNPGHREDRQWAIPHADLIFVILFGSYSWLNSVAWSIGSGPVSTLAPHQSVSFFQFPAICNELSIILPQ